MVFDYAISFDAVWASTHFWVVLKLHVKHEQQHCLKTVCADMRNYHYISFLRYVSTGGSPVLGNVALILCSSKFCSRNPKNVHEVDYHKHPLLDLSVYGQHLLYGASPSGFY